jgi:hypothetical protein
MQKQVFLLWVFFSFLVLTGCGILGDSGNSTSIAPTLTKVVQIPTRLPILTVTAPALAISSQTPTQVASPTPVPTLELDKAYDFLKNLFQPTEDCQLPCWSGIRPGISSNAEAETIVQPLSSLVDDRQYAVSPYRYKNKDFLSIGGGRGFVFGNTEISFFVAWKFEQGKDTVEVLRIEAGALELLQDGTRDTAYGAKAYNEFFEAYNLHNIVSTYGIPSKVLTFALVYNDLNDKPHPNPEDFRLWLLYEQGIFIQYKMPVERIGSNIGKACPSQALFDMSLVSPQASQFYEEMWSSSTNGDSDYSYYRPVSESTQMTLEQFYQAFSKSNNPCFEVRLDIWPEH